MAKKRPKVALVYDFDGTLSPGNMQEFGFIQATGKTKVVLHEHAITKYEYR